MSLVRGKSPFNVLVKLASIRGWQGSSWSGVCSSSASIYQCFKCFDDRLSALKRSRISAHTTHVLRQGHLVEFILSKPSWAKCRGCHCMMVCGMDVKQAATPDIGARRPVVEESRRSLSSPGLVRASRPWRVRFES